MIRRVELKDIPEISKILDEAYAASPWPIGGGWNQGLLKTGLSLGEGILKKDLTSGEIEGFVIYQRFGEGLDISVLATSTKFRRQGVMVELIKTLTKQLKDGEKIWLEVHTKNVSARKLYEKLHFSQVGERAQYYRDGGDAILYEYRTSSCADS